MSTRWEPNWLVKQHLTPGGQGNTSLLVSRSDGITLAVLKELRNNNSKQARTRMYQEVASLRVVHTAGAKVPRYIEGNTEAYEDAATSLYFIMEYVVGPTLEEYVARSGPLHLEYAVRLTLDLCNSIRIGHAQNILHRDLKPRNIVIRSIDPPDAVILDYGLSFNLGESLDLTPQNEAIASTFLSLPEGRAPGDNRRDPRSDLTALCGVLCFCLTGSYPGVLQDSAGKPPHRRPKFGLPEQLANTPQGSRLFSLFDRGFSPLADSRYQDIGTLTNRLEELLAPDLPDVFDNPIEIARQASEELLKKNRATQIHKFTAGLQTPMQEVQVFVRQMAGKLGQFSLGLPASYPSIIATPLAIDDLLPFGPWIWELTATAQKTKLYLVWQCSASGDECTLHQGIFALRPTEQVTTLAGYSTVYRWQGLQGPEAKLLIRTLNRALSSAIQLFVGELRTNV